MEVLLENRQARHNFVIEDTLTAGLKLEGWEVKAIRAGRANFNGGGAFVRFTGGEAWVDAMTITPLPQAHQGLLAERNPARARKLLLNRAELKKLGRRVAERGYTVVPLAVLNGHHFKLQIGLAKGKKLHDKREALKTRDLERAASRGID